MAGRRIEACGDAASLWIHMPVIASLGAVRGAAEGVTCGTERERELGVYAYVPARGAAEGGVLIAQHVTHAASGALATHAPRRHGPPCRRRTPSAAGAGCGTRVRLSVHRVGTCCLMPQFADAAPRAPRPSRFADDLITSTSLFAQAPRTPKLGKALRDPLARRRIATFAKAASSGLCTRSGPQHRGYE